MTDSKTISLLLYKYSQGTISEEEMRELENWKALSVNNQYLFEEINDEESLRYALAEMHADNKEELRNSISLKIREQKPQRITPVVHRVHFLKTTWFKYAAAIIIIFGIGAYLWNNNLKVRTENSKTAKTDSSNEILPGGQKALLTLADGSTIILDSAANGQLATQGNSTIIKKDGIITYESESYSERQKNGASGSHREGEKNGASGSLSSPFEKGGRSDARGEGTAGGFKNTMSTPRGGQYQLTLADGTKVWLNAASSITYPTVFNGKIREVSVTGEVYFDVAKNKSQPFIVSVVSKSSPFEKGGGAERRGISEKESTREINRNADGRGIYQITVLGTEFNINAYPDETSKTSLINGSVIVTPAGPYPPLAGDVSLKAKRGWTLQPGDAFSNNKIIKTNIAQDIAWKNGVFDFNDLNGEQAMRQLSRWYDVEIKYEGNIKDVKFGGELDRSLTLNQVLRGLEGVAGLHFTLQGNTLIVKR